MHRHHHHRTTATTTTTTSRWLTTYPGCVWRIVRTQEKYNLVQNPSLPDNVVTEEAMIEMLLQQNETIVARLVQAAGGGAAAAAAAGAAAPREEVPAPRAQPVWSSWRVDGHDAGLPPDMDVPNSDVVQAITCVMCSVMCRLYVCGGCAWACACFVRGCLHLHHYHHRHTPHSRRPTDCNDHRTQHLTNQLQHPPIVDVLSPGCGRRAFRRTASARSRT